ncbi:hypothetical protein [Enterococcus faecalis]|uniref:hypothetical protein n=1 Tax=Enterococcus faecalis TaxID=1351 RepID=UPI000DEB9FE1|nr:hypothetical protein [Enterococcus faecalis]RBS19237.1 hypothetical protein EA96_01597 [Enterococcus faecalis]
MSTNVKPVATINGKKYPLIFGFKFLNEINALKPDVEEVDGFVQLIGGLQGKIRSGIWHRLVGFIRRFCRVRF